MHSFLKSVNDKAFRYKEYKMNYLEIIYLDAREAESVMTIEKLWQILFIIVIIVTDGTLFYLFNLVSIKTFSHR